MGFRERETVFFMWYKICKVGVRFRIEVISSLPFEPLITEREINGIFASKFLVLFNINNSVVV
jgi:hypothetical protein